MKERKYERNTVVILLMLTNDSKLDEEGSHCCPV